jgi:hypothetical protein
MARWQAGVAWSVCAMTVLGAGIQAVLIASAGGVPVPMGSVLVDLPLLNVLAITAAAFGAMIVSRYPRHPIGWLLAAAAFGGGVGLVTTAYLLHLTPGGLDNTWSVHLALRVVALFSAPYALALLAILFLLAPDGRLPSRRWRPALALPILGLALNLATVVVLNPERYVQGVRSATVTSTLNLVTIVVVLCGLPVAGVALVRRLRAAHGEQRQQLRWIATSAFVVAAGATIPAVLEPVLGDDTATPGWRASRCCWGTRAYRCAPESRSCDTGCTTSISSSTERLPWRSW